MHKEVLKVPDFPLQEILMKSLSIYLRSADTVFHFLSVLATVLFQIRDMKMKVIIYSLGVTPETVTKKD